MHDDMEYSEKDFQIPVSFKGGTYIVQFGSGDITLGYQMLVVNS